MTQVIPEITLHDGLKLPAIGFGTSSVRGVSGAQAIRSAIDNGYRLIDSAYNYENEGTVGKAIKNSQTPRQELTVTSKLPGRFHRYNKAIDTIQESLYRADLDYYDLYLIHWPNPNQDIYLEAWEALREAKKWGLIRSIGVCNFLPEHLERLKKETGEMPSINQIELHPFFNQADQLKWHQNQHIQTESWSPLARANEILQDETIQTIAKQHNKTATQIILRWHYQLGTIPIPKSMSPARQRENISIFDFNLTDANMTAINKMGHADGRLFDLDPATHEEF